MTMMMMEMMMTMTKMMTTMVMMMMMMVAESGCLLCQRLHDHPPPTCLLLTASPSLVRAMCTTYLAHSNLYVYTVNWFMKHVLRCICIALCTVSPSLVSTVYNIIECNNLYMDNLCMSCTVFALYAVNYCFFFCDEQSLVTVTSYYSIHPIVSSSQ